MYVAGADRNELEATSDLRRRGAYDRRAVPYLSCVVSAPAIGGSIGRQCARMRAADGQRREGRRRRIREWSGLILVDTGNASPAIHLADGGQPARPHLACAERLERQRRTDSCRR